MKRALQRALTGIVALAAGCGTDASSDDTQPAEPAIVTGHITADAAWGDTLVTGDTFIDPGVTVTIDTNAVVELALDANLEVDGVLEARGTGAAPITFQRSEAAWPAIFASGTGVVTLDHVSVAGVALYTRDHGALHMVDSKIVNQDRNYFVMQGGSLDVSYSDLGAPDEHNHCVFHLNPGAYTISVQHSNVLGSQNALMFDGGTNADFRFNNWIGNSVDVESTPGSGVSGDFSDGYFAAAPPVATPGNVYVVDTLASTPLADAGPR